MKEKIAVISILANIILAGGKIFVSLFSGSAAILAEGAHSFMDIFSSAVGYIGIRISKKPEDKKHPYGHYKFEVLMGVIITIILLATGARIIYEAYQGFLTPEKIKINYKKSFSLGKEAVDSLLDVSADEEIEEKIKSITKAQNIEISSLKT